MAIVEPAAVLPPAVAPVGCQVAPASTLLKTPAPLVPTNIVLGLTVSTAKDVTLRTVRSTVVNPTFAGNQVPALFVLLNVPLAVPTYNVAVLEGSIPRVLIFVLVRPVLAADQEAPALML